MTKTNQPDFDQTVTAYAQVRQAAEHLRTVYNAVCERIDKVTAELEVLPLAPVPFDDLKAGILEFITASGQRYAGNHVRGALRSFATNQLGGVDNKIELMGKPLRFIDLERAISGEAPAYGWAQVCHPDKRMLNDQVFYCFFAELVKEGLARVMESMDPAEFGYDQIHPDKVGTPRAERLAALAALETELQELQERKQDLRSKLAAIGFAPTPTYKGSGK